MQPLPIFVQAISTESPINPELLLGQFIPLHYHYQMLLDEPRMLGFRSAIHHLR